MKIFPKNLKISLKFKIAFFFILLVVVMMGTVTYIYTIHELDLRVDQVKLRMERLARNIATIRSVETKDWDVYQSYIDNQIKVNPDIVYIAIFDEDNILKAHSLNRDWIELDTDTPLNRFEEMNTVLRLDQRQIADESQKDLESKSVNIIIGDQTLGTVKVGFSLVDLNDEMRNNLYRNFALALVFIVLAIIVSYIISQKVITPLEKLTHAMEKISEGDLNQELYIDSRDEIGEMAKTFNFMAKGLQEKQFIERFSHELEFTIDLKKITKLITRRLTQTMNARQGILLLREKVDSSVFRLFSAHPDISPKSSILKRDTKVCQLFLRTKMPLIPDQLKGQNEFISSLNKITPLEKFSLITPMIINEEVIGIFILHPLQQQTFFNEPEKSFLNVLIRQAGFAIENALLLSELTEQERLKRELEIARMVQKSLLPSTNPFVPGLEIDGICIPAAEIGGDYYDYFLLDDHRIGVAIADVTGKGASAAFYMAVVKGSMTSLAPILTSPSQLLIELNRRLYSTMDRRIFVTMIYGIFDLKKKKLTFVRAGHNALIIKDSQNSPIKNLTPKGIGLGLEKGDIFNKTIEEQEVDFKSGDIFFFYTDGITEAMDQEKQEFGEDRLIEIISRYHQLNPETLREKIISEIRLFVKDTPQHDDITMVTISAT